MGASSGTILIMILKLTLNEISVVHFSAFALV